MAWTQSDLDKIDKAIASGNRRIQFGDRMREFRSQDELLQLRRLVKREVSGATRVSRSSPVYDKDVR